MKSLRHVYPNYKKNTELLCCSVLVFVRPFCHGAHLTYLHVHCLQHSFFEHLFNLFYFNRYFIITVCLSENVYFHKYVTELDM